MRLETPPVGYVGRVSHRIRGGELAGEVAVLIRGGSEKYMAYSEDPLAEGTEVLIWNDRGFRQVDVTPLSSSELESPPPLR